MPAVAQDSSLLFVYGTLRRGAERHDLLQKLRARYIGKGSVAGELFDLGPFPGAIKRGARSRKRVAGELYRLADASRALKVLDEYEGVRSGEVAAALYRRDVVEVWRPGGERASAWIYWLSPPPPGARRIESGDYAKPGGRRLVR